MQKYSFFLYGGLTGLICVLYVLALHGYNPHWLLEGWESLSWLFLFVGMLLAGLALRKKQPYQFIEMQPLFALHVQVFGLAYGMKYVFVYLLFTQIDKEMLGLVRDFHVQNAIQHRDPNTPEAVFQAHLQAIKSAEPHIFDAMGLGVHLLMGTLLALLLAFLLKQEKPDY